MVEAHVHHRWLVEVTAQIQADYDRLHVTAGDDPQRAGHGGEATWADLLRDWLPPAYEVVTRRYIVPEIGDDCFEMDLVVLSPGYPRAIRGKEEVMAGGVAAAFSARLTVDAEGIADGLDRAVRLRRGLLRRDGSPLSEMVGAFPVGLLAHGHDWTAPGSNPAANVANALELGHTRLSHPREMLDYACIANLGTWCTMRAPFLPPQALTNNPGATPEMRAGGAALVATVATDPEKSPSPVGVLVATLYQRLAYADHALRGVADGFRLTDTLGEGSGAQHLWGLDAVFSKYVCEGLADGRMRSRLEWESVFH